VIQLPGEMVRGEARNQIRSLAYELTGPELPATTSFFEQQDRV